MAEKETKKPVLPHQLKKDRKRVCGKWREKDYKPTKDEEAAYKRQQQILASANERIEDINKGTAKK